jgi:hypothetical protein
MSAIQEMLFGIALTVFGAILYQGVYLMFPEGRRLGAALTAFSVCGLVLAVILILSFRTLSYIPVPRPIPYISISLLGGILFAVVCEAVTDLFTQRQARALSRMLNNFADKCLSRTYTASRAHREREEEDRQRAEYIDNFGTTIHCVHDRLVGRGLSRLGNEKEYFGTQQTTDFSTHKLAVLTSRAMARFSDNLPYWQHWYGRRLWLTFSLYLALAFGVWVSLFTLSADIVPNITLNKDGARMEIGAIAVSPPTTTRPFFFNIHIPNRGKASALQMVHSEVFRLTRDDNKPLESDELDKAIRIAIAGLPDLSNITSEVAAGDAGTWFTANDDYLKADDYNKVLNGSRLLYLFVVIQWRDRTMSHEQVGITEMCAYFTGSFAFYHTCPTHNRTYASVK